MENMQEFIKRAQQIIEPQLEGWREQECKKKWGYRNREKLYASQKKYYLTEKGQASSLRRSKRRQERFAKACEGLSFDEYYEIEQFYEDTPAGMVVDHIIPIAKGGLHRINNIQYLTVSENATKAAKLNYSKKDFVYMFNGKAYTIPHTSTIHLEGHSKQNLPT